MLSVTSLSIVAVLLSIAVLVPEPTAAAYELVVTPYTYKNEDHRDRSGHCCDYLIKEPRRCRIKNQCDNIFVFCLRGTNVRDDDAKNCPLGRHELYGVFPDNARFSPFQVHSFSSSEPWPGSATLYVRITDVDWLSRDDHVDNLYIPIRLNPGESIRRKAYKGFYRRGSLQLSFRLSCQPNFYGRDCVTNCVPTDVKNVGHFKCDQNGKRLCLDGWKDPGNHCLTPVCDKCNSIGGRCTAPNNCTCLSGWSGMNCDECVGTSTGCSTEGGYCRRPGECRCREDYRGDNCEVYLYPCENEPCKNEATCVNDGKGGYHCQCSSGYIGRNCTVACESGHPDCNVKCYNSTSPCENGGVCQVLRTAQGRFNGTSCVCRSGFTGDYCEESVDDCRPNPCRNGGTCQNVNNMNYMCTCAEGFTGSHCDVDIDYCVDQPCRNNGTCIDLEGSNYMCVCPAGWKEPNCSIERDECEELNPCQHGATCTDLFDDYKCDCVPGFMGHDCEQEINECSPNPCRNGNCTDLLNDYSCQCFDEFTGVDCETDLNSCRSSPCLHGGSCENAPDGFYVCSCLSGYTGFNCEIMQLCLSTFCYNNGTCVDEEDDHYCICAPGFTGVNCSVALNVGLPVSQEQGAVRLWAIVGGVSGGMVLILLLLIIVVLTICLQRRKSSKCDAAIAYYGNGQVDGYHNPTYESDVHIQDAGTLGRKFLVMQSVSNNQMDKMSSKLEDDQVAPLITGEQEEDEFDVEYHNFDNPQYAEGGAAALQTATPDSPTYNRTALPGPRGQTSHARGSAFRHSSNDSDNQYSSVPAPVEYAYVSVNQEEVPRSHNTVTRESANQQSQQQDGIYELLGKED